MTDTPPAVCWGVKDAQGYINAAKVKRVEAVHIGAKIRGPGFHKAPPQRRASKPLNKWFGYRDMTK